MQLKESINIKFLNTDKSIGDLKPYESPFLRGLTWDINANPVSGIGSNNPSGEGQNELILSDTRSNAEVPNVLLPDGYNKHIGFYESVTTQEGYEFKFNSNGSHGIYVISGNTGIWQKVVIDSDLQFTDDAENFIANHRVSIRFVKDKNNNIIEKYLILTDGGSWQKYINVIAAIRSNGFDSSLYPYWKLKQPHFDRRELLEWPVRPPMYKPIAVPIPNSSADKGKLNRFLDKGFQIAVAFQNTDGRTTTLSPISLPILIKSEDFLNNPDNIPKNVKVTMPAGSPLTEKILFYIREAKKGLNTLTAIENWSDWSLYDTINKFPNSNSSDVLGTDYWLRTNPFAGLNYNTVFNTIDYTFDLSKVPQIVIDQELANSIQTEMPQISVGQSDLGDPIILVNNRYGYPNFGTDIMGKLSAEIDEKPNTSCPTLLRKLRLYCYTARCGDDFTYTSQVGYYNSDDKAMLFGGLSIGGSNMVDVDINEHSTFDLNFADKDAFRCYLKGTPYYSDGTWYQVNSDNTLVKLQNLLDIRQPSAKELIQTVFVAGGYFVCVFDFDVPAGKYIATLGRHNVSASGDYRNKSTYIYGIANSRVKSQTVVPGAAAQITSIKPNAINNDNGILYSKEMEIDCTNGNVDVWGNNHDLFYVYCPYITQQGNNAYRFIEGYWKEISTNPIPVEMFPYRMNHNATDDWGRFTDKNGFYWAYTKVANSSIVDIEFVCKINCAYPVIFSIPTSQSGIGWKQNSDNFLADNNGGIVGNANRVIYNGKITSIDGTLNYSNIAISIKDGTTVYTNSNGEFTMIIHNGSNILRVSNVYINAGSNFFITLTNCGQIPLYNFSEALAPCSSSVRTYPIPLLLGVNISTDSQTSLKEDSKINVGIWGADLAGRVTYVNVFKEISVPSFLERNNLRATFLRMLIAANIDFSGYQDMKWLSICVSKNVSIKRYVQWVGDQISYIDNSGNTVTDPSSAVFASIKINSLFNSNVAKNFSLLSTYQFVAGDRIRVFDDGDGNLFDVATYGDPINLQILGTNYSQAAINSGLLPPQSNTVLTTQTTSPDVALIVKYDTRIDKLINKTGFWIEIYTPTQQSDIIPFYEVITFPIINGKVAEFTGFSGSQPQYTYPASIDLVYWDTYLFDRSITIPDVGNKNFGHPFESPNVTDNWGADVISGGRNNIKNDNAKQFWLGGETIKSDNFLKEGLVNGLATFRSENKKDFGIYPFGAITAVHAERNILAFVCENDWFITDYNYHYAFVNAQGVMQANLDDGLSTPHQKVGDKFGMVKKDTATFIAYDKQVFWYDRKNTGVIRMNYRDAIDITEQSESEQGGMESYFNAKTDFITVWNNAHGKENSFDVVAGIDIQLAKYYVTFRCRRNNSNDLFSYVNDRRNWQLNFQETVVYDITNRGWIRSEGFTPEGYGSLRGDETGTQLISYAAGKPYFHAVGNTSFNNFYGRQTTPVIYGVLNAAKDQTKIYEGLFYNGNPSGWFVDMMYTDFYNSFSYLSVNKFRKFFNNYFAAIQRNGNSYPSNQPQDLFRSMFLDGYRMGGRYFVFRMVGDYAHLGQYKELGIISGLIKQDQSNKKATTVQ